MINKIIIYSHRYELIKCLSHNLENIVENLIISRDSYDIINHIKTSNVKCLILDTFVKDNIHVELINLLRSKGYLTPIIPITTKNNTEMLVNLITWGLFDLIFDTEDSKNLRIKIYNRLSEYLNTNMTTDIIYNATNEIKNISD